MTPAQWPPPEGVVQPIKGPDSAGGAGGVYRAFGETLRGLKTTSEPGS